MTLSIYVMTVKNSDGTNFKLSAPNPIMKDQSLWSGKIILHNFNIDYQNTVKEEVVEEKIVEKKENIVKYVFFCLPAREKIIDDSLYGEARVSIVYLEKFTFECLIVSRGDFELNLWTKGVDTPVKSILFDIKERRWWLVSSVGDKAGGILVNCVPSAFTPSFD